MTTAPHTPPQRPSDEAEPHTLAMAREQGSALRRAIEHMIAEEADDGHEVHAGDYRVGYAVESAEGMYQWQDGELVWMEPERENVHVEVCVRDAADGRFIPGLTVYATLYASDGQEIGTYVQPFLWHPWLYHYGRNWEVPGDGEYRLTVRIEPPPYGRHDRINGCRFREPVEVEFTGVRIRTGQKKS